MGKPHNGGVVLASGQARCLDDLHLREPARLPGPLGLLGGVQHTEREHEQEAPDEHVIHVAG